MAPRALILLLAAALAATSSHAQVTREQPDANVFTSVQTVGATGNGDFVAMYGCSDNGATLSYLSVWANDQFIRGLQVRLTDGREVLFGCLNTTRAPITVNCGGPNMRSAVFDFQAGELVTNLTLWPGYNSQGQANQRAGAINMMTSKGRTFDFGMTSARNNPVSIDRGSGIPCGVAPRAGADIDALGFVFLLPVTSSTLQDVQYQGVPANQVDALDVNTTTLVLNREVYNNSGKANALVSTYTSDSVIETPASWSQAAGLDTYLTTKVSAATPQLTTGGNGSDLTGWALGPEGAHTRQEAPLLSKKWNYTVTTAAGAVSQATASVVQAQITTTYSGNLSVVLSSGATISLPVAGTYEGTVTSPVTIDVEQIQAPTPAAVSAATASEASSPGNSGGSNNTGLILGIIFGILGGLFFAALVAWAVVLIMRHRAREDDAAAAAASGQKPGPGWFFIPVFKGGKGDPGVDEEKGKPLPTPKDREPGGEASGSGGSFSFWGLRSKKGRQSGWGDEMDPKMDAVMGVPVPGNSKEIELPAQAPRATQEAPEGSSNPYLSYSVFRKLRLESIRGTLGLGGPSGEGAQKAGLDDPEEGDSAYHAPQPIPPASLSTRPSLPTSPLTPFSTPDTPFNDPQAGPGHESRVLDEAAWADADELAKEVDDESTLAKPTLDQLRAEDLAEEAGGKVESPKAAAAEDGDDYDDARSTAVTEPGSIQSFPSMQTPGASVASSVAGDSKAPSSVSGDYKGRMMRLKDRFAAQMAARRAALASPASEEDDDGALKDAAAAKEPSRLVKLARSVSSMTSRSASIQHDDAVIAVKGKAKRPTPEPKPADGVSGGASEATPDEQSRLSSREGRPEQAPGKRSKVVEHEDASLMLGEGYQAPPDAKSVPRRKEVDLDDTRLRLGEKYRTQGRNE